MMKRLILVFLMILYMITILCFAAAESNVFWGSFTPEKTYSFDHRYYALQTVENPTRTGSGISGASAGKGTVIISGHSQLTPGAIAGNIWTAAGSKQKP